MLAGSKQSERGCIVHQQFNPSEHMCPKWHSTAPPLIYQQSLTRSGKREVSINDFCILTADATDNAATYFSTDSVGDLRTHFNIILLVRYVNISVAVMYCYLYLPIRTALQVGRSRVRFPMVSLEFFIDIILPAALWPCG